MKRLGIIYNVFDGIELWRRSIEQIRKQVDFIVAIVQTVSNYGEQDSSALEMAAQFQKEGLIDSFNLYLPNLHFDGHFNETAKRNLGIEMCRQNECTHYLLMDVDEYYEPLQFAIAKKLIEMKDYDSTACGLYTYFKEPTYKVVPKETYHVPFIQKLYPNSTVGNNEYAVLCDQTRMPKPYNNFYLFREKELIMHHMSHVRKDYIKKLRNSSAQINWKPEMSKIIYQYDNFEIGKQMPFFSHHEIEVVPNQFNIVI